MGATYKVKELKDKIKSYSDKYDNLVRDTKDGSSAEQQSTDQDISTRRGKGINDLTEAEYNELMFGAD